MFCVLRCLRDVLACVCVRRRMACVMYALRCAYHFPGECIAPSTTGAKLNYDDRLPRPAEVCEWIRMFFLCMCGAADHDIR